MRDKSDFSDKIKKGFFLSCSRVSTFVWISHLDLNNGAVGGKSRLDLHRNAECCIKQIMLPALYKTTVVRPLISHLTYHPSKTNKTCRELLNKQWWTRKKCSSVDSNIWTHRCWPTSKTYIHHICTDTDCSLDDLDFVYIYIYICMCAFVFVCMRLFMCLWVRVHEVGWLVGFILYLLLGYFKSKYFCQAFTKSFTKKNSVK